MKGDKMHLVVLCVIAALFQQALSHTTEETNAVVRSMLRKTWQYSLQLSHGDASVLDWPATPDTWQGFLRLGINDGWTTDDKEAAFDWYLSSMSNRSFSDIPSGTKEMLAIAVSECASHAHTNAFQSLVRLAVNSEGRFRERAIDAAFKCAPLDGTLVVFAASIATNVVEYNERERALGLIGIADKLSSNGVSPAVVDCMTRLFYQCRHDGCAGVCCDVALTNHVESYALSSNRLETAYHMLSLTNMPNRFSEYYIGVTNQLLSSGRHLQWINVGGNNP